MLLHVVEHASYGPNVPFPRSIPGKLKRRERLSLEPHLMPVPYVERHLPATAPLSICLQPASRFLLPVARKPPWIDGRAEDGNLPPAEITAHLVNVYCLPSYPWQRG
jgi:hypothetical protein